MNTDDRLDGMRCPECGNTERFEISVYAWATVERDGISSIEESEWNEYSRAICPCGHTDTVGFFQMIGRHTPEQSEHGSE